MPVPKAVKYTIKNNLEVGDFLLVGLKKLYYFHQWDWHRDVCFYSKSEMEKELGLTKKMNREERLEIFKKSDYMAVQTFVGFLTGYRDCMLEIEPTYGPQQQYEQHFNVPIDIILDVIHPLPFKNMNHGNSLARQIEMALDPG